MRVSVRPQLAVLLLCCLLAGLFSGCGRPAAPGPAASGPTPAATAEQPPSTAGDTGTAEPAEPAPVFQPACGQLLNGKEYGRDYISLYDKFGREGVGIRDVTEDPETGLAYLNAPDGRQYELGLDFLSMAMVYNTDPAGSSYATPEEVYAAWWRYYVTRWNLLLPEIPLYNDEIYELFSAKFAGLEAQPVAPYAEPVLELCFRAPETEDGSLVIGSTEELTGRLRFPACGVSGKGSAGDNAIYSLISGLETVCADRNGRLTVNPAVVKAFERSENPDGSVSYTVTLYDDLKFSDGSPVTARNYLYFPMVFSSHSAALAFHTVPSGLRRYVGYEGFHACGAYEAGSALPGGGVVSRVFPGLRLLDEHRFSVTVSKEYVPYFFAEGICPALTPTHRSLWLESGDIADDGEGCYFTDDLYASAEESAWILEHALHADPSVPCAGPYALVSVDEDAGRVVLQRNPRYKASCEGEQPSVETVIWQRVAPETALEELAAGRVDYLSTVAEAADGGTTARAYIDFAEASGGEFLCTHRSRASYGKLAFRCDLGPVQFPEVRQAVALCMDRPAFAAAFTGGAGSVPDGPYCTAFWAYRAAAEQGMVPKPYTVSRQEAVELLEAGGWIYDKDGGPYTEGVRYKKIPGEYATESDLLYQSPDGVYATNTVGGDCYMPLLLCWYGAEDRAVTDALEQSFAANELLRAVGFTVYEERGPFDCMLDEFHQQYPYSGARQAPTFNVFSFSVELRDPVYDRSFRTTMDPALYDDYNAYYLKDPADIYWN